MVKAKRVEIDSGNWENGSIFSLEEKIKKHEEGVDYEVDKTGNFYTIISERLKKIIWPNDYSWYNESVVAIDREGKIESWRMAAENPIEPYKRFKEGGLKEIMSEVPQLNDIQKDRQKPANTSNVINLAGDSNKGDNKVFLIITGVSILVFIPIVFFLIKHLKTKKTIICQRKTKKNQ